MEIVIVRHADPDYSIDSLTPQGWKEAELLSEKLSKMDVTAFYCSPLGRAKDTASLTLKKVNREAQTMEWLREFEGRVKYPNQEKEKICWDLMPAHWTKEEKYFSKDEWCQSELMQSGNVEEQYGWVTSQWDELLAKHGYVHEGNHFKVVKENHDRIVLFCHYGVSCVLLGHLLGISPVMFWQSFVMTPSSITTVVTEEREQGMAIFRLMGYGDTGHLFAGGEEPSFAARWCECFSDDTRH